MAGLSPARLVPCSAHNPEPRSYAPLDTPYIFLENGTQTVKMQFDTFPRKIQNRCILHPCVDEKYSGFLSHSFIKIQFFIREPFLLPHVFCVSRKEGRRSLLRRQRRALPTARALSYHWSVRCRDWWAFLRPRTQ